MIENVDPIFNYALMVSPDMIDIAEEIEKELGIKHGLLFVYPITKQEYYYLSENGMDKFVTNVLRKLSKDVIINRESII